jgi:hypothetical protein
MSTDPQRVAELARAIQFDIDELQRRDAAPRTSELHSPAGPSRIRLRISAATEAEAEQARRLIEQLLATLNCQMQPARAGANPRYVTAPRWLCYGSIELPALPARKRRRA